MKKIVALVLTLVLALSLATVAFADTSYSETEVKGTTSNIAAGDKYAVYELDGNKKLTNMDSAVDGGTALKVTKYTTAATKTTVEDGVTTVESIPAYYTIDGQTEVFYVSSEACATARLFKGDNFVCYLNKDNAPGAGVDYAEAASAYVAKDTSGKCGTYSVNVYIVDGKAHEAKDSGAGTVKGVYDGMFVQYATGETNPVAHTWKMSKVEYKAVDNKGHMVPVAVTCSECGAKFDIVENLPASYKGAFVTLADASAQYSATPLASDKNLLNFKVGGENAAYATYKILTGAASAAAGTTTTGVSSAKTFDAGVALYAGMALMSVAGSAVVIGKKKEF